MKKFFKFILFILIVAGIIYGARYAYKNGYFDTIISAFNSSNNETKAPKHTTTKKTVDYSEFPESWNNLFDIDNVTINYSMTFMGGKSGIYKIVDGKYYLFNSETGVFDETTSVSPLKYQDFYKSFTFNEETKTYSATNVSTDESYWVEDIDIKVNDGKIISIITDNHQASLHIVTTYTFSNYGVTTITE